MTPHPRKHWICKLIGHAELRNGRDINCKRCGTSLGTYLCDVLMPGQSINITLDPQGKVVSVSDPHPSSEEEI